MAHFAVRLTKRGAPNRTDVRRLFGSTWKVPLRYTSFGIRKRNPDVGWPEEVLHRGEPPEEYAHVDPEQRASIRARILARHPSKFTPDELVEVTGIETRVLRGEGSEADLDRREEILAAVRDRHVDLDEW